MTALERRKQFREMFGERLIPEGFFWKKDRFYRLGDQVFLQIGLRVIGGDCTVRWGSFPFCMGFDAEVFSGIGGPFGLEPFLIRDGTVDMRHYLEISDNEKLDINYRVFFRDVFNDLNAIRDVGTELVYMNKLVSNPKSLNASNVWQYINLAKYANAAKCIRDYLNSFEGPVPQHLREYYEGQQRLLKLIEAQDYETINCMLRERIEKSTVTCEKYFCKTFRKDGRHEK